MNRRQSPILDRHMLRFLGWNANVFEAQRLTGLISCVFSFRPTEFMGMRSVGCFILALPLFIKEFLEIKTKNEEKCRDRITGKGVYANFAEVVFVLASQSFSSSFWLCSSASLSQGCLDRKPIDSPSPETCYLKRTHWDFPCCLLPWKIRFQYVKRTDKICTL